MGNVGLTTNKANKVNKVRQGGHELDKDDHDFMQVHLHVSIGR